MIVGYATGGKLVLMPVGRFDPDTAMQIIEREKVTAIGGVPTVMWRILESPNLEKFDLSSVKRASYGGAPAAPELVERIEQAFPNLRKTLSTAYGLTETASVATAHGGDDYFAHPGSVGRAAPTVELRVVDEHGQRPAGRGAGRGVDQGPDGHGARLLAPARRERGRVHRRMVPHRRHRLPRPGRLPVPRRPREGHDHPRRRERVLASRWSRCCSTTPTSSTRPWSACRTGRSAKRSRRSCSCSAGSSATEDDIRAFCKQHLADFKVPAYVEIRDEPLPRNPAGKVLKNLLRGGESAFAAGDDQAL